MSTFEDELRRAVRYEGGNLYWVLPFRKRTPNLSTGPLGWKSRGGLYFGFLTRRLAVHRVVFFLHHGWWPEMVDHINGNQLDNRIENLQAINNIRNNHKGRAFRNSTSQRRGVHRHRKGWVAKIEAYGRLYYLGKFSDLATAIEVRALAERIAYGDCTPIEGGVS